MTPSAVELGVEMDDKKRKLWRYSIAVLIGGVAVGFLLALAWASAAEIGVSHHIHWITSLGTEGREAVGKGLILAPLLAAAFLIARSQKRLMGDEIAARESEDKRQLSEEKTGIGWKVPKSAEAADWPKVVVFTLLMYVVTFISVFAICSVCLLIDWLIPHRSHPNKDMSVTHAAFSCANLVGIGLPALFVFMLLAFPRTRISLISSGVMERGGTKKLIPYASIRRVCIVPSRRRRALKCFAILSTERDVERWHRYEFGKDAPVADIVKAFEAKGLPVEIIESQGGEQRSKDLGAK